MAQDQLKTRQAAQQKWQDMQAKQAVELETVKSGERERIDLEAWRDEEEAVQKRLEEEQFIAEQSAQAELKIIENAVRELAASVTPSGIPISATAEDQARLKALLSEREVMQERVQEEQSLAGVREKELEDRRTLEAERLKHAISLANAEAEAQSKAAALDDLEKRLQAERELHRRELEVERARILKHEDELQAQMKELMRSEIEKPRTEMTGVSAGQLQAQLDAERKRLAESEARALSQTGAAEARIQQERESVAAAQEAG